MIHRNRKADMGYVSHWTPPIERKKSEQRDMIGATLYCVFTALICVAMVVYAINCGL